VKSDQHLLTGVNEMADFFLSKDFFLWGGALLTFVWHIFSLVLALQRVWSGDAREVRKANEFWEKTHEQHLTVQVTRIKEGILFLNAGISGVSLCFFIYILID